MFNMTYEGSGLPKQETNTILFHNLIQTLDFTVSDFFVKLQISVYSTSFTGIVAGGQ